MAWGLFATFAIGALQGPVALSDGLTIGGMNPGGRVPVVADSVQSMLAEGTWKDPAEGEEITGPDGKPHKWARLKPGADGFISDDALGGGYYFATYDSPSRKVMMLNAQGDSIAYVNGAVRAGDPYGFGWLNQPVQIEKGVNRFLFFCARGRIKATLSEAKTELYLQPDDATLPDVIPGVRTFIAGVTAVNPTTQPLPLTYIDPAGAMSAVVVPALSSSRIPVRLKPFDKGDVKPGLKSFQTDSVPKLTLYLRARQSNQTHRRTFVSKIDGSVQYYAVNPAQDPGSTNALILSLHGASVEAQGQSEAYSSKPWATIICPTNRRPYGFDWEDWGRMDAIEALEDAGRWYPHDPFRTCLTGHSMGGHGSWQVSTTFPDRFAAVGPSAGWESFFSYAGGLKVDEPNDAEQVLLNATAASHTMRQIRNLGSMGVYILHGDKDDNVPVAEARTMRDELAKFHTDYRLFEQPGAGHWWDASDEPGADCVDWAPMFDLFARRRIAAANEIRDIEFHTAAPNVSAKCHWVTIEQQLQPFTPSSVTVHVDPGVRRFTIKTENVETVTLDTRSALGDFKPVQVVIDGDVVKDEQPVHGKVTLRHFANWRSSVAVLISEKRPARGGGFKNALRHNIVLVYGTHGSEAENAWALNKARMDSESWWYRGNGKLDLVPDDQFNMAMAKTRDVLVIGNSNTNSAWAKLAGASPVNVANHLVTIGADRFNGDNLTCLFCRPAPGAADTMVAFLGVTGLQGGRVAERLPYFVSGVAYPDYTVISTDALKTGLKGVLAAGYFDNAWRLVAK